MHLFIENPALSVCPKCNSLARPHTACPQCGFYRGKEMISILGKLDKKERKRREKEMSEKEKQEKGKKPLTMEELSKGQ